ncbi:conjugative transposon protein TraJ [Butyricimonas sp.]|uniref:conjugative transposon protein TraJ n=1 Tax=Butyricimonas sp. TaxID=1969738 RepID=UPI0025BB8F1F|nr:conjugative transposon protein TraJ [Butyricimonas sp.]
MMLLSIDYENMHQLLRDLYDDMMPLCGDIANVARVIAALGALLFISNKVWASLARAEPIDVYPLLRPLCLGLCILIFPTVLNCINGVLSPVVVGAHSVLEKQTFSLKEYREQKEKLEYEAMVRNPETAYLVDNEIFDKELENLGWSPKDLMSIAGMYLEREWYRTKKAMGDLFRAILEIIFLAASLVLDTLRTFFLVILSILAPLVFALSCFDGLQASLTNWLTRYIGIYLWLPISDLFSAMLSRIQVLMVQKNIANLDDPSFIPDSQDSVYIIFLIIGILGYFMIPTVADWIIKSGGAGNYQKTINDRAKSLTGIK